MGEKRPGFSGANLDEYNLLKTRIEQFAKDRFVYIPSFIDPIQAHRLDLETRDLPTNRVRTTNNVTVAWDEQKVPPKNGLNTLFDNPNTLQLISSAIGAPTVLNPRSTLKWVSRYSTGEYIDRHTDSDGTVQLLVCLSASNRKNGGYLILKTSSGGQHEIFLETGDAVLFEASKLEHFTTPLMRTDENEDPKRTVAIARYYF